MREKNYEALTSKVNSASRITSGQHVSRTKQFLDQVSILVTLIGRQGCES